MVSRARARIGSEKHAASPNRKNADTAGVNTTSSILTATNEVPYAHAHARTPRRAQKHSLCVCRDDALWGRAEAGNVAGESSSMPPTSRNEIGLRSDNTECCTNLSARNPNQPALQVLSYYYHPFLKSEERKEREFSSTQTRRAHALEEGDFSFGSRDKQLVSKSSARSARERDAR